MKPDTIKTGAMPSTVSDSARIGGNDTANLPNNFGKSREEKNHGGFGSGRGQGGKETTSDMRALDIRRLQRDGLLTPGRWFMWKWSRDGEEVASIQISAEADRVILNYRSRNTDGDWSSFKRFSTDTTFPVHYFLLDSREEMFSAFSARLFV